MGAVGGQLCGRGGVWGGTCCAGTGEGGHVPVQEGACSSWVRLRRCGRRRGCCAVGALVARGPRPSRARPSCGLPSSSDTWPWAAATGEAVLGGSLRGAVLALSFRRHGDLGTSPTGVTAPAQGQWRETQLEGVRSK